MFRILSKRSVSSFPKTSVLKTRQYSAPVRYTNKASKQNALATAKPWSELSTPQKGIYAYLSEILLTFSSSVVVASKTTFNVGIILTGFALTSAIVYYIGSELFGSQSTTSIFSDAVDRVKANEEIVSILGEPIKAHGEPSRNSRRRNRRIASQVVEDQEHKPHLFMRFYLEGSITQGTVMLEMIKDEKDKWQYRQLYVDVPGQGLPSRRIYLERK
ncbi:TIM21-domain-containing protein [Rhizopus microsporus var. microsporus]|uniref:Mitochondrial import inner membrane translocase subunit Tim21 n=2 Tax=Rhizopus microsporus TaxID=58291 RepID=A0A2G4SVZ1_RHIZD|nr:TIM21-domain-containing protein [Rhizopus microsporus ATCC 52813]ORE05267.1 TIM21-domain-containing protein [Rhizopus microsporus var. microsporus]PHZ12958.1 TIM21-domain-containing protein [Rhizopus microsporus ATCC 52813]